MINHTQRQIILLFGFWPKKRFCSILNKVGASLKSVPSYNWSETKANESYTKTQPAPFFPNHPYTTKNDRQCYLPHFGWNHESN